MRLTVNLREVGYVLNHICLFVGWLVLSAGLHKSYRRDFGETCMEDGSQPRIDAH